MAPNPKVCARQAHCPRNQLTSQTHLTSPTPPRYLHTSIPTTPGPVRRSFHLNRTPGHVPEPLISQVDHTKLKSSLDSMGIYYFGGGLPVAFVAPGSPAEESGLEKWDCIVKINEEDVRLNNAQGIMNVLVQELNRGQGYAILTVLRSAQV